MKILPFILAVYILSLNFILCADVHDVENSSQIEIVQKLQSDHGHPDADLCSPFCICQCCQMNVVTINMSVLKLDSEELYTAIFSTNNGFEQNFLNAILQPPQI